MQASELIKRIIDEIAKHGDFDIQQGGGDEEYIGIYISKNT